MGFAFPMYASTAQWHTSVLRILSSINLQFVCLVPTVSRINAHTFTIKIRASSDTDFFFFRFLEGQEEYLSIRSSVLEIEQAALLPTNILQYLGVS